MPPNLLPGKLVHFAGYNIDILDEKLDGENTFHATMIAALQRGAESNLALENLKPSTKQVLMYQCKWRTLSSSGQTKLHSVSRGSSKRMVCYSWQCQRFCQYCPSNWYGIQHQFFRLQPMNLIILQCFYWNQSHPDNGNQSDGRTEIIDSNIFKSSLSNLLFWNPANQTSGTMKSQLVCCDARDCGVPAMN